MRHKWNYHWLRNPRTTQERRRNSRPEEYQFTRGKRRRLPTIYDDITLPYFPNHESWKRLRPKQYREREV